MQMEMQTWAVNATNGQLAHLLVGGAVHAHKVHAAVIKAWWEAEGCWQIVLPAARPTMAG